MFKVFNLAIRFILELVIMFSLGYWGFHYDSNVIVQIALGLGMPLLAAIIWGKTISPKATIRLPLIGVLIIELFIFGMAFLCLIDSGFKVFAMIFGTVAVVNRFIIIKWKQQLN
ncbi:DUF2568 domain-containing protein [Paenibacillus albiflavus]|uniref:DUF2568 domain-containing protein n=1 Tax=Paenibacillus albiflavus TaxID=2545760 RepID=A0A4R4ELY9_9BACL|nr:YrdB family protein [Paenibacillus albiflavus]TCZ79338.1 DUF2568 domain-containing protein [Paenibacillus albiflavus]